MASVEAIPEKEGVSRVSDVEEKGELPAHVYIDPVKEKKLMWKVDLRVLPPLTILFLLAFLDRTNIGNAKIQGLTDDLKMTGTDYNVALLVFFVPYILFEVPSNMLIKRMAPSTYLSAIMVLWGIGTIGQGLVTNKPGLIAMRVLVGFFEAGLFPGCVYIIGMYYKRYEMQKRLTLFFSASILSGAFAGLLAYAIAGMAGVGGYNGWRWIFIIEGLVTVAVGLVSKWWVVDWPETAKFLNDEERAMLIACLAADQPLATMNHLDKRAAKRIFGDWRMYCAVFIYFGIVNTGYAGSFFIPTIIKELGFTSRAAQVRSIPIFVVATCTALIASYVSDKVKHRYAFCMLGLVVASVGYIILICQRLNGGLSVGVKYFALFLITPGGYITQPLTLGWISNCMGGHYKRSVAAAMQVGFGNAGGIVASTVFITAQAPYYKTGYSVSLALLWICGLSCTALFVGNVIENKKRDRGGRDYRLTEPDVGNMGDAHPSFRYAL